MNQGVSLPTRANRVELEAEIGVAVQHGVHLGVRRAHGLEALDLGLVELQNPWDGFREPHG